MVGDQCLSLLCLCLCLSVCLSVSVCLSASVCVPIHLCGVIRMLILHPGMTGCCVLTSASVLVTLRAPLSRAPLHCWRLQL